MSDIINWIRSPIWILAGQSYNSHDTIDDLAGGYFIKTGNLELSRKEKEDIIIHFPPYRAFRGDFSDAAEYLEGKEYFSKFTCEECKINQSHDGEDRSGPKYNDWTKIVSLIAIHWGHTWSFFAELEDFEDKANFILYMDGRVA